MKKEFKYTIIDKETGDVLVEQIVTFGSEKNPFPSDWKDNPIVQIALQDYKDAFLNDTFNVTISEETELEALKPNLFRNFIKSLRDDRRICDKSSLTCDLSDIGNTIGFELQKAINSGNGDFEDFMRGLRHGMDLVDKKNVE